MNVSREWLIANGVEPATLDALAGPRGAPAPPPKLAGGEPGRWEVVLDGWRPTLASELKCHPMKAARRKKADATKVYEACSAAGVTLAEGRRRVGIAIRNRAKFDPDAPLKSLLDALTRCGAIVDDADEWADWQKPVWEWGERRTIVTIEDAGP